MAPGVDRPAGFRYWRQVRLGRERRPAEMTATRRDGTVTDIRRSLGLGPRQAPDPMADNARGWRAWP